MPLIDVAWMDRDAGVVTLGENGVVSTWTRSVSALAGCVVRRGLTRRTRQANNKWQWAKILDASDRKADDSPSCLAFCRDRIAIGYPKSGVKVWLFIQGARVRFRSIPCHADVKTRARKGPGSRSGPSCGKT